MPGRFAALIRSQYDWGFDTVPQKACDDRVLVVPRGRLLGGCSAMNGTLICRGAKADYDRIAQMGNSGWSWNDLLPFFKASETFHPADWHGADMSVHGSDGPLHTTPYQGAPISERILQSFIDRGFVYKPDMFAQGEYEGVGHPVRTIYQGVRQTSATFLHAPERTNLSVRTRVYVDRIVLEKSEQEDRYRAVGVEAHDDADSKPYVFKARKEIILSAG